MKRAVDFGLLVSFIVTVLVPVTGIPVHKAASTLFLILTIVHAISNRRALGKKRWLLLALVAGCFVTGLAGMILEQFPLILTLHRALSIGAVFFLAIHIFVFRRRLRG